MTNGYLQPGQSVGLQSETNFIAGVSVNGATPSGGGRLKVGNILIGPTALASIGTDSTGVAGRFWLTDIFIPVNRLITKIGFLQGTVAAVDKTLVAIWDSYGNLIGSSAVAGVVLSGASTFQEQAIVLNGAGAAVTSVQLYGPQRYFIGVQTNGTAAGDIETVATATYIDILGAALAGTFGTVPATITPPTTFTADRAPIVYVL
jgi:hypothetical protein